MNLTKQNDIREVCAPVAAANNTDQNSDRVDTSGFDSVTFIVPITDSVATGVATMTIEENESDSDTGMEAITNAVATATCAVNDDLNGQLLVVEVKRPTARYVQCVLTSETANIAFGNVIAILSEPRTKPTTEHSTIADMTLVVN